MLGRTLIVFLSLALPIIAAPLVDVNGNLPVLDRRHEPALDVASANVVVRDPAIDVNVESIKNKREVEEIEVAEEEDANDVDDTLTEDLTDLAEEKRGIRPGKNIGGQRRGVRPGNNIGGAKRGVRPGTNIGGSKRGVRPGKNIGGSKRGVRPGGSVGGN